MFVAVTNLKWTLKSTFEILYNYFWLRTILWQYLSLDNVRLPFEQCHLEWTNVDVLKCVSVHNQ